MASGIKIDDRVVAEYKRLKDSHELVFLGIRVSDKLNAVEVCEEIDPLGEDEHDSDDEEHCFKKEDYDGAVCCHLLREIKDIYKADSVYLIADWYTKEGDKAGNNKVYMMSWVPENCNIRRKMVHASTLQELKKALNCGDKFYELHDEDDIDSLLESLNCPGTKKANREKAKVNRFVSEKMGKKITRGVKN